MKQLDFILGSTVMFIKLNKLPPAIEHLEWRININEKEVARCRAVSETEADEIIQGYNFNIGTALKHIFAFTRTIKKGNRPNKTELKIALKYLKKEVERLSNEQN